MSGEKFTAFRYNQKLYISIDQLRLWLLKEYVSATENNDGNVRHYVSVYIKKQLQVFEDLEKQL
jgi:hypothetical protein